MGIKDELDGLVCGLFDGLHHLCRMLGKIGIDNQNIILENNPSVVTSLRLFTEEDSRRKLGDITGISTQKTAELGRYNEGAEAQYPDECTS